MLQSSLPTFIFRHLFYRPAAGTPPKENSKFEARSSKQARNPNGAQFFEFRVSELFRVSNFEFENGSGSGSRTHLNEFIPDKSGCALVEFPAINWWSPAGNAPAWHCLQGRRFTFQPRPQRIGRSPWCCPRQTEFWRLCRTSWCATCRKLKGPGVFMLPAPAISTKNKHLLAIYSI